MKDILCETSKERDKVLKELENDGFVWISSGVKPTEKRNLYEPPVIIAADPGKKRILQEKVYPSSIDIIARRENVITAKGYLAEGGCQPCEVRLYRNKNAVTAVNMSNKKAGIAFCSKEDAFDFFTGAKLALERLEKELKKTESVKEKYFCGKVVCVDAKPSSHFKKGKIYPVKKGRLENDGIFMNGRIRARSVEDLNVIFTLAEFIEVVE